MTVDLDAASGPRCNIGAAEIRRRRWIAVVLTLATLIVAAALVSSGIPHVFRIVLWPVAAGAGVSWLQVVRRFCVRFGLTGFENFGAMGQERRVAPSELLEDQRRARQLIGEGILAGLLAAVALVNLPL